MKIRVPEYFTSFKCIADKCLDSCCIGWEIDVDDTAMAKYAALDTELGREIMEKTSHGYFPLQENGRCAFLDERGLCRIISAVGDGHLCDICREHPRYYGVGDGVIEGGLGLGCEEAARMLLELDELPRLIEIERDVHYFDEDEYADVSEKIRNALFESIFTCDIRSLIYTYLEYAKIADEVAFAASTGSGNVEIQKPEAGEIPKERLSELYSGIFELIDECEALTDGWDELCKNAKSVDVENVINTLDGARGLIYYFTHRYVREGVEDMSIAARILFAITSSLAAIGISKVINSDEALVRSAVMYSKNIEYSTDNVDVILEGLCEIL